MSSQSFNQKANKKQSNEPTAANQPASSDGKKRAVSAKSNDGGAQQNNPANAGSPPNAKSQTAKPGNQPGTSASPGQNKPAQNNQGSGGQNKAGDRDHNQGQQNKDGQANKPGTIAASGQNKPGQNKQESASQAKGGNRDQNQGQQNKDGQAHVEHDNSKRETTFHFESSSAKNVLLAGDFSEWDKSPIKMMRGGGNVWHAKVALTPGRHAYRFVVDGEWQDDPNKERIPNSFGSFNNVMDV